MKTDRNWDMTTDEGEQILERDRLKLERWRSL